MQTVIIIIPILNEEELLEKFYISLKKKCLEIKRYKFKFLFVVDKSKDNTEKIIHKICNTDKQCSSIIMDDIYGHQECLYAGLVHSKSFDLIITMDGDFQHPINLIEKMILENEAGADAVFTIKKIKFKNNIITKFLSNCFYIFFNFVSEQKILNNSSDFRLVSKKILNQLLEKKYNSVPFLRSEFFKLSNRKKILTFDLEDRDAGSSKFTIFRLFKLAFLGLFLNYKRPIKIIFASFVISLISKFFLLDSFSSQNNEIVYLLTNYILILLILISFIVIIFWISGKIFFKKSKNKIFQIKKKINIK